MEPPAWLDSVRKELYGLSGELLSSFGQGTFWIQAGLVAGCLFFSWLVARATRKRLASDPEFLAPLRGRVKTATPFSPFRLTLVITLWIATAVYDQVVGDCAFLKVVTLIVTAFFVIKLPTRFFRNRFWMTVVTTTLFIVATTFLLGLHDNVVRILEGIEIPIPGINLNLFQILSGTLTLVVLLWLAGLIGRCIDHQLERTSDLQPSMRVLLGKTSHLALYVFAIYISLRVFEIDLAALAIFGGALGLGIGFGLQKVISNFFSGVILLMDKSIKPGDVIEIGETYGWINSLKGRYVSVITRDNKEHLIPNEDMITNPVINWSFSDRLVRLKVPVGISYSSDVREAMKICEDAAASFDRVVIEPPPRCLLRAFGDSSVDLELRFWIEDPSKGTGNITSDVLLKIWDTFKENDIEIPFPQSDVHIRSGLPGK